GAQGGQIILVTQGSTVAMPKPVGRPDRATDVQKEQQRNKMRNVAQEIKDVLAPLVSQGKVKVLETSRGVSIEINDSILFSPGQARLEAASVNALRAIAEVIARSDFPITIEGHTDDIPINTPQFPSNWELSAVRATTVLRLFADAGVMASRLTAIGYGDQRPVESNTAPEGRARNRRVTILIDSNLPEEPTEVREGAQLAPPAEAVAPLPVPPQPGSALPVPAVPTTPPAGR
ncbi:MAG: hypothetical protein RIR00_1188, partial [Pseudomonadota bacterium]